MAAYDWDDLRGLSLARQFPGLDAGDPGAVVDTVRLMGPIQSQAARSPYVALGARLPGASHDDVTAAYDAHEIVRGSSIRGTVHTSTAAHHVLLDATTRVAQRAHWVRHLRVPDTEVDDLWRATEEFASPAWRTPEQLLDHLRGWLRDQGHPPPDVIEQGLGRYLAFGHGGLVRRPLKGTWSGQGAPGYRFADAVLPDRARPEDPLVELVRLHLASYGPATRRDIAWWSGLGLRQVDAALARLEPAWHDGPGGQPYADLPGAAPGRDLPGVHLLPEFDAVLCGYDPKARDRFVTPENHVRLWHRANGYMLAPLLVDGRIGGFWRLEGTGRTRSLAVTSFAGSRKPRKTELDRPVAALTTALGVNVTSVSIAR